MSRRPGILRRAICAVRAAATWTASSLLGAGGGSTSAYNATDPKRKFIDRLTGEARSQANAIIAQGMRPLQAHARHLERNNPVARGAIEGLTSLVVGSGIGIRPNTGDPDLDEQIHAEFMAWWLRCQVDGADGWRLQERTFREVVPVGEGVWRYVVDPDLARSGEIPLRVLMLDTEWLADVVPKKPDTGVTRAPGMDLDALGRPVRYYLKNPDPQASDDVFAVPADRMELIFERRRALQNRGESWFAPVLETLIMERQLVDAELYAAQQTAGLAIAITSEYHSPLDDGDLASDSPYSTGDGTEEDPAQKLRIGSVARLFPGESVEALAHSRPSQQIAPFRKMLHGDIAASMRLPRRFLDRDISDANYSSMRADMLDCQRLLGPVREWFGHATIGAAYQKALPWILLKLGVSTDVPDSYELLPDEQPYVDPEKDVRAALMAIHGKLDTYESVISARGRDYRDVWDQSQKEGEQLAELGLAPLVPKQIHDPTQAATEPAQPEGEPNAE